MSVKTICIQSSCIAVATTVGYAFLSWSGTQLYAYYCMPSGLQGFLQSLVTMDSSPCQALFKFVNTTQTNYSSIITFLVVALLTSLTQMRPD